MRRVRQCLQVLLFVPIVCLLLVTTCAAASAGTRAGSDPKDATVVTKFVKSTYFLAANAPVSGVMYSDGRVAKGANFLSMMWVLPNKVMAHAVATRQHNPKHGVWVAERYHKHAYNELLFFGSGGAAPENIAADRDLGGKIDVWLAGERHVIKTLSYVFIPKGTPHKIAYRDMSKPIMQVQNLAGPRYKRTYVRPVPRDTNSVDDYGWLIWDTVRDWGGGPPAGISANYIGCEDPTWMDEEGGLLEQPLINAGFPFSDNSIILPHAQNAQGLVCGWRLPHAHTVGGEYFMAMGTNGYRPSRLGASTRWVINDKVFALNKTGFVFVPAGTWHCPIDYVSVSRPAFFMTLGSGPLTGWDFLPRPLSDWPEWPGVPPVLPEEIPDDWPE